MGSILPAIFKENLRRTPEVFDQSEEAVNAAANKGIAMAQAVHKINDAKRAASVTKADRRKEFLAQRREFVRLREDVKALEVRINDKSFTIREWEKTINKLIVDKKKATAEMRLGDERGLEQQIQQLEDALETTKRALDDRRKDHKLALKHFRQFDRENLKSLAAEIGEELTCPPLSFT
jgi:predicted RNase H-like nuclease (RuvC/YqgF family)